MRDELLAETRGEMPALDEIKKLRLTKMIFEESMRLFPPAAMVGRKALQTDNLGGQEIVRGTNVNLAQWVTHRHPEFWEQPETFDPRRFERPHHPFAYFPFGAGLRECIGKNMAMVEGIAILAGIVKNYRFRLAGPKVEPRALITVRPDPGVTLQLERLNLNRSSAQPVQTEIPVPN